MKKAPTSNLASLPLFLAATTARCSASRRSLKEASCASVAFTSADRDAASANAAASAAASAAAAALLSSMVSVSCPMRSFSKRIAASSFWGRGTMVGGANE